MIVTGSQWGITAINKEIQKITIFPKSITKEDTLPYIVHYYRLVVQPEGALRLNQKPFFDTSVDRHNYGILIWGSRNVSDLMQLWDLGLTNVLCTAIASSSVF